MKTLLGICCVAVFAVAQTSVLPGRMHITASRMTTTGAATHLMGVVIDTDSMVLKADTADFDKTTKEMTIHGDVRIHMKQPPENSK
jgi:hypothetical protein